MDYSFNLFLPVLFVCVCVGGGARVGEAVRFGVAGMVLVEKAYSW